MSITFDRDGAVKYATTWAMSHNPNYSFYNTDKNTDCMNFVSQCLHEGAGMPKNKHGNLWYAQSGHSPSWTGVQSFINWLQIPWGKARFNFECLPSATGLLRGDIVFNCASGTPGDITRGVSHVVILSQDYDNSGNLIVCGHTHAALNQPKPVNDRNLIYIHFITGSEIIEEYSDDDYADDEDYSTANTSMGLKDTLLKVGSSGSNVRALQTRLNYLGYNCGEVDGIFGDATEAAVTAYQSYFQEKRKLSRDLFDVDGKVGEKTKEALHYPKGFF